MNTHEFLEACDVIVTTCIGAANKLLDGLVFKLVIVDEACQVFSYLANLILSLLYVLQASEPEALIPLLKICKEGQIVLVGDPKQV